MKNLLIFYLIHIILGVLSASSPFKTEKNGHLLEKEKYYTEVEKIQDTFNWLINEGSHKVKRKLM